MRKSSVIAVIVLLAAVCLGQQSAGTSIKVSGCVESINGEFRLIAQGQTYILKGDHDTLFEYTGMLVEVTGKLDKVPSSQTVPAVLHVTKLKKLADTCG